MDGLKSLSSQQRRAFDNIRQWHKQKGDKRFVLAGYAGAGKTTLAKVIADELGRDDTIFCAYTGKAANVLREKDCMNAGTIHRYLYSLSDHDRESARLLQEEVDAARKSGNSVLAQKLSDELAEKRAAYRQPKYELNYQSALAGAKLVIVDEYSMLDEKIIGDIEKLAKKVLYIGDPFQLPPVRGECSLKPDYFIEEIHRQALDSPIIRYSRDVREGRALSFCRDGEFDYQPRAAVDKSVYTDCDQLIVGLNKTRVEWNRRFRELKGYDYTDLPREDEKMICLKNNHVSGLFNGMIGRAESDARGRGQERYVLDFDGIAGLNVWRGDVDGEGHKYDGYNPAHRILDRFDFGYAITAHKSQGSEFDHVVVYNQPIGRGIERQRWLYTAITRGKKKVTLVEP